MKFNHRVEVLVILVERSNHQQIITTVVRWHV
jgi:aspartyl/asparaginyl beta-hydroxylase (cupin superfamily)